MLKIEWCARCPYVCTTQNAHTNSLAQAQTIAETVSAKQTSETAAAEAREKAAAADSVISEHQVPCCQVVVRRRKPQLNDLCGVFVGCARCHTCRNGSGKTELPKASVSS